MFIWFLYVKTAKICKINLFIECLPYQNKHIAFISAVTFFHDKVHCDKIWIIHH